jgi:hypothetical protein
MNQFNLKEEYEFNTIKKTDFLKYEKIRQSGEFNMFMDARKVAKLIGISKEKYRYIIDNYAILYKVFIG